MGNRRSTARLRAFIGTAVVAAAAILVSGAAGKPGNGDRQSSFIAMRDALAELFEPERNRLRLPAEQLSAVFLSLLLIRARDDQRAPAVPELVDLFLHGAVTAR